jgi:threonine/homoserine/homoserine lactone efflux protein
MATRTRTFARMQSSAHLWLFFLMVLGIVVLPGMDMAFIVGSSLSGGRRAGLLALAGVMAGAVFHVAASGLGIGLLLNWVPGLFNAMLLAGAVYIAWIGWSLLRSSGASTTALHARAARGSWATFRQALVTSLLNPKAYLFMLAVFPQFVRADGEPFWMQAIVLGLIIWVVQAGVYGSLALAASSTNPGLGSRPRLQAIVTRLTGGVLIAGAVLTAMQGWRPL